MNIRSQVAPKGLEFRSGDMIISGKYCTIFTIISYPKIISEGYLANLTQYAGIKVMGVPNNETGIIFINNIKIVR